MRWLTFFIMLIVVIALGLIFNSKQTTAQATQANPKNTIAHYATGTGNVTVSGQVLHALDGDTNKNNRIDSGDKISFVFTLTNASDTHYTDIVLETGINRSFINSLQSLKGAVSYSEANNTLTFPSITLLSKQSKTVSFDARLTYGTTSQSLRVLPQMLQGTRVLAKGIEVKTEIAPVVVPNGRLPRFSSPLSAVNSQPR